VQLVEIRYRNNQGNLVEPTRNIKRVSLLEDIELTKEFIVLWEFKTVSRNTYVMIR